MVYDLGRESLIGFSTSGLRAPGKPKQRRRTRIYVIYRRYIDDDITPSSTGAYMGTPSMLYKVQETGPRIAPLQPHRQ